MIARSRANKFAATHSEVGLRRLSSPRRRTSPWVAASLLARQTLDVSWKAILISRPCYSSIVDGHFEIVRQHLARDGRCRVAAMPALLHHNADGDSGLLYRSEAYEPRVVHHLPPA